MSSSDSELMTPAEYCDLKVECKVKTRIPTTYGGSYDMYLYHNNHDNKEHVAFVFSPAITSQSLTKTPRVCEDKVELVRIHSECFTGEIGGSMRCDCGEQLDKAIKQMSIAQSGIIIYLRQEGRGIGLLEKLKAYNIQDKGYDTVEANVMLGHQPDLRTYDVAALMLKDLGCNRLDILTNNPDKIKQISNLGLDVVNRIEMTPSIWQVHSEPKFTDLNNYMSTKVVKMGHMLQLPTFD